MRVVDLTTPLNEGINSVYPGYAFLRMIPILNYENHVIMSSNVEVWLHAGTHVDAPLHVVADGSSIEEAELSRLVREAIILDLTNYVTTSSPILRETLDKAYQALKKEGEEIREGDIIILRTDWSTRYNPASREYRETAPYLTEEAVDWLLERKPSAVGFDFPEERITKLVETLGSGKPKENPLPLHVKLLGNGVYLIEHLTNLNQLRRRRVILAAAPLKIKGAEGSPVRAFAIEV